MKKASIRWLCAVLLALAAIPATAQFDLYDNGPTNGSTDAWNVGVGPAVFTNQVTNSFAISSYDTYVTEISFAAWLYPGSVLQSAIIDLSTQPFGGTTYYDDIVNFSQSGCQTNQYGYSVCTETSSNFYQVNLPPGTYWLRIGQAKTTDGDPVYWDENSGPSSAEDIQVGTIPSESFTVWGYQSTVTTQTTVGIPASLPEPASVFLFGSGAVGILGFLRRKTRP